MERNKKSVKNCTSFGEVILPNSLKCAKCRREFTLLDQSNYSYEKSRRPHLLPCGHNMCENCIYQFRSNLVCAVCSVPIVVDHVQQRGHKINREPFVVRKHFKFNYYMMGQLFALYYLNDGSLVNQNHTIALSETQRNFIDCSECNATDHLVNCRSCTANYCINCFKQVHSRSNALQMHKSWSISHFLFQKINMKKPVVCTKGHLNNFIKYCLTCREAICYKCAGPHLQHNLCTMRQQNRTCLDQSKQLIGLVREVDDNVRDAKKLVSNTEVQIKQNVSETMDHISNYFLELHNILQIKETEIRKYVDQFAAPICDQTKQKLEKYNKHQNTLTNMRLVLQMLCDKIPNHFELQNVVDFCQTKLDTLKSELNVSQVVINPYCFNLVNNLRLDSIKEQLTEMLQQVVVKLQCNSANISSSADKAEVVSLSADSESSLTDITTDIEPSMLEANFTKYPGNHIVGNKTAVEESCLKIKQKSGRISHIENAQLFYVQFDENKDDIEVIALSYDMIRLDYEPVNNIIVGKLYMLKHQLNDEFLWYRVKVVKKIKDNSYNLFFIDVGLEISACMTEVLLFECYAQEGESKPAVAKRCSINNLMPVAAEWSAEATSFFIKMLRNQNVKLDIFEETVDDLKVDVWIPYKSGELISLRNFLLYAGYGIAQNNTDDADFKTLECKTSQHLISHKLLPGESFLVRVLHVEHPQKFTVIKISDMALKNELKNEMQLEYEDKILDNEHIYVGSIGLGCAALIDKTWQRAVIEQIENEGKVLVNLVDEGHSVKVDWHQLYVLKRKFQLQREFGIRCMLADVEPLREHNYSWSQNAIENFKRFIIYPNIYVMACGSHFNYNLVSMNLVKKDWDFSVGAMLAAEGECISTGNTSKDLQLSHIDNSSLYFTDNPETAGDYVNRTNVVITYMSSISCFFVQLQKLQGGIDRFYQQVQLAAEQRIASFKNSPYLKKDWQINDHCLINVSFTANAADQLFDQKYQAIVSTAVDQSSKWYRGVISHVNATNYPESPYIVFLRDIGATYCAVNASQLLEIDEQLARVANGACKCYLGGIGPTGNNANWSFSAIDFFKHIVQSFTQLSVTMLGASKNNAIPVLLWGNVNVTVHAIAPDDFKYSNINKLLVEKGWATPSGENELDEKMRKFDFDLPIDAEKNELALNDWLMKLIDNMPLNDTFSDDNTVDTEQKDEQRRILNNLTDELIEENAGEDMIEVDDWTNFVPMLESPAAWLKSQNITKSIFTATPTYVDDDCIIYLHDAEKADLLKCLDEKINNFYLGQQSAAPIFENYELGQPCIARYHQNQLFYRGIVMAKSDSATKQYKVIFIDYGNEELVSPEELLPVVPYPYLPPFAHKYNLHGICPKNGATTFDVNVLDAVHRLVVGQFALVRVMDEKSENDLKSIEISINGSDVINTLIMNDLVERIFIPKASNSQSDDEALSLKQLSKRPIKQKNPIAKYTNLSEEELFESKDKEENAHSDIFDQLYYNYKICLQKKNEDLSENNLRRQNNSAANSLQKAKILISQSIIMTIGNNVTNDIEDYQVLQREKNIVDAFFNPITDDSDDTTEIDGNETENSGISRQQYELTYPDSCVDFETNANKSSLMQSPLGFCRLHEASLPNMAIKTRLFPCKAIAVLTPTIVHIFPELGWFQAHEKILHSNIQRLVKRAPALTNFAPKTICLACSSTDNVWYRAVIRKYMPVEQEVIVLFVDYMNIEVLPLNRLRTCPKELLDSCLRGITVSLHGIRANTVLPLEDVRQALMECIYEQNLVAKLKQCGNERDGDLPYQVSLHEANEERTIYAELIEQSFYEII